MGKLIDLTGQKFNKLLVIKRAGSDHIGHATWQCQCECGTYIIARGDLLRVGKIKSCKNCKNENLTGQIFGNWTVKQKAGQDNSGHILWLCQCTCGKQRKITGSELRNSISKKCNHSVFEDLTGKTFGEWKVIKFDKKDKYYVRYWLCQCSCGTIKSVAEKYLKTGHSKSCGHNNVVDLQGKVFGKLRVIKRVENNSRAEAQWLCQCECGSSAIVSGIRLRNGSTISCGCITSKGESKIKHYLDKLEVDYKTQYSFNELRGDDKCLKFDFVIFKNNSIDFLIEYQGEQHFRPVEFFGGEEQFLKQQEFDNKKRDFCKQNNFKLIEIPYWDYNIIDENYIKKLLNI